VLYPHKASFRAAAPIAFFFFLPAAAIVAGGQTYPPHAGGEWFIEAAQSLAAGRGFTRMQSAWPGKPTACIHRCGYSSNRQCSELRFPRYPPCISPDSSSMPRPSYEPCCRHGYCPAVPGSMLGHIARALLAQPQSMASAFIYPEWI
jgi:hypothetical protein